MAKKKSTQCLTVNSQHLIIEHTPPPEKSQLMPYRRNVEMKAHLSLTESELITLQTMARSGLYLKISIEFF